MTNIAVSYMSVEFTFHVETIAKIAAKGCTLFHTCDFSLSGSLAFIEYRLFMETATEYEIKEYYRNIAECMRALNDTDDSYDVTVHRIYTDDTRIRMHCREVKR